MIVVSDSSPLIALAQLDCLDIVVKLFPQIYISAEVYNEVVIAGAGLPGAREVARGLWIVVKAVQDPKVLRTAIEETGLGAGEMSAILFARELGAEVVLMDERRGRRVAEQANLNTLGCVGVLEALHTRKLLTDLRLVYERLLEQGFRIDRKTLQASLEKFGLGPLTSSTSIASRNSP